MAAVARPLRPRVLVLPFPAQGHVMPLMELSHRLVEHGIEVDFVNTDFNHARVMGALAGGEVVEGSSSVIPEAEGIHLVSFPDGMGPDGDRTDVGKLAAGLPGAMLGGLEEMVVSNGIKWAVVDVSMSWALKLATTVGVRVALFSTFSAAIFALRMHVPKFIEDGIIDENGSVKRKEKIQLGPKMPAVLAAELPWTSMGKTPESRRAFIQGVIKANPVIAQAEIILCNTFQEIESEALALLPKPALAVGPLEEAPTNSASLSSSACHFWAQDQSCLAWLDAQEPGSVVYVAFGSMTVFDAAQLQELADALLLCGRPFLWVVRPNITDDGSDVGESIRRRIGAGESNGVVVDWAPQQRVLSHPALACFVTHSGWNSTMEGLRYGVPLLCWPYFADQFCNRTYVCDVWRTGVRLCADEQGLVTKEEIGDKLASLLRDQGIRERVMSLKTAACASLADGGSSHQDLLKFVRLLFES
ncbi:hypothetical protein PR202_ga12653 [Eleusine coracana subsp. coracana]|uniref:Glycosyltransferase n=1 Tax=Eleusine coracana subsp. coracana TaxID=191504 RepID=A0AAV5CCP9_ELECO|nr:hypothetical protein QOZ80_3AG0226090 [Eleusine coracana subsp. coracana]GJM95870.1 hypothetical protein PR202_ga12653 [Eleusine coracana subsp. coracana]